MSMGGIEENGKVQSWKDRINFNTILASLIVLLSIAAYVLIPYQIEKPKLIMGRAFSNLSPTLFPRIAIFGLLCMSLIYLGISFGLKEKSRFRDLDKGSYFRSLVTLIMFCVYGLLFETLGFVISSVLVMGTLTLFYGNRSVLMFSIVVCFPLGLYLLFTRGLHVSLPEFPF